jgi:hypothetical protein
VLGGILSPLVSPVILGKEYGVPGFFGGLLMGTVVGAGLVTAGAGLCSFSLFQVFIKSPEELSTPRRAFSKK